MIRMKRSIIWVLSRIAMSHIGYCDVEGGCAFKTAEELVSAPVFDGKSLRERWSGVMINGIGGLSFEEWLKYAEHVPLESTL